VTKGFLKTYDCAKPGLSSHDTTPFADLQLRMGIKLITPKLFVISRENSIHLQMLYLITMSKIVPDDG
jgi:hypothetical protein